MVTKMRIDLFSLFPNMFSGPFSESLVSRAQKKSLVTISLHQIRDFTHDKHKSVDEKPYGGGEGMVMMCPPLFEAVEETIKMSKGFKAKGRGQKPHIILLTPQGKVFNQKIAQKLAKKKWLMFICGHYEGVDERIRQHLVDEEISIGDYVLTGGEIPAMVVIDAVVRLVPGVVGKENSVKNDSFSGKTPLLEYPHYTRPENFRGWKVPPILLSGNHQKINEWREKESLARTKKRRPDLLKAPQSCKTPFD